ncbi:GDP-mannose 4,6-dehydratase [Brevibacillus daliensis]|uniref:GDP-mannose 4,6-dehydratase n=1 Tax=Brevibacillus daliensis TaxID=2892995 RepID=UPI001E62253F|nr:GDP-mannose 4,6-dehydratase [Brevibacillus daliensis]
MGQRVLVTGGAGFIGSHLVDSLLADQYEVLNIDNFDPFYDRSVKERNIKRSLVHPHYTFKEYSILDRAGINQLCEEWQPDLIVHLAAKAGVRPSVESPQTYFDTNVTGTVNIMDAAVTQSVKKVILASSSSVYGLNQTTPFAETDPILDPASPYGASKIAGEAIGRSYSHCYSLPVTALRFFTVYGPRQRPDLAIHKFARKIVKGESIPVFGDGTTSRDYTFIDDIVAGIRGAMEREQTGYDVFNLGNDQPVSLRQLIEELEEALGKKAKIDWLPPQIGDVPHTWANIEKAKQIGYCPKTDFKQGIHRFVEWLHGSKYEITT